MNVRIHQYETGGLPDQVNDYLLPGHSAVGEVLAVGKDVQGMQTNGIVLTDTNHTSHARGSGLRVTMPQGLDQALADFARMANTAITALHAVYTPCKRWHVNAVGRRIGLWVLIASSPLSLLHHEAWARAYEVRLLSGSDKDGVWGTAEFQVSVNWTGLMRHVTVGGKELVWQAAALYTYPVQPGSTNGVRTVQGEGSGERGLSVEPPTMDYRDDHGKRVLAFRHLVSSKKVLEGKPLCRVDQTVVITPTGEISVSYDCQWLETIPWGGFCLLILFQKENVEGRDFIAYVGNRLHASQFVPGGVYAEKRITEPLKQLTVWSDVGPFHYVFETQSRCDLSWHGSPQLSITPTVVPYQGRVYKGLKERMAYRILLPVSQQ